LDSLANSLVLNIAFCKDPPYFYLENYCPLMRKIVVAFVILALFSVSCKKAVDNIKEDLMDNLITSNTWIIVRYLDGGSNITSTFATYEFKFYKSGKVDAVKDGITQASGTWVGSEANQSITSEFPSASDPFNKLTGVWIVTNTKSKPWRVYSHRFEGSKELVLDLQEKQ
jgi:hypothetical protein